MAEGWGPTAGNKALDDEMALYTWMQLHIAAPGAAGTTSPAVETTRKQITWGAAAAGAISSTAGISWTNVAGSEDYTHFTTWTLSSAGTFGISGTVTANPVVAGDTFSIASGDVDVSLVLAS